MSLSEAGPNFQSHITSLLTPAFFLFAPVFLCPFAVLFSPLSFPAPEPMRSHTPHPRVLLFHPEPLCSMSFHAAPFLLAPCSHGRWWWCSCTSWATQSEGEVHQRGQEELSGDTGAGDVLVWWSWLGRCAQVWGRRDRCGEPGSAVARRGWDGVRRSVWEHCEEVVCVLWGTLRGYEERLQLRALGEPAMTLKLCWLPSRERLWLLNILCQT